MDIEKLCADSHQIAKDKGWLDGTRSRSGTIALMHSEISEALEEYRNHKGLNEVYYNDGSQKPEGIPIELADLVIRICQHFGTEGWTMKSKGEMALADGFEDFLADLHLMVSQAWKAHLTEPEKEPVFLGLACNAVIQYCAAHGIGLQKAIEEKQGYNTTRSHRHGGKKL